MAPLLMGTPPALVRTVTDSCEEPLRTCRFCLCEEGEDDRADEFVEPCLCRGTSKHVHLGCLLQHFKLRGDWHNFKCPTCNEIYDGVALCHMARLSCEAMSRTHGLHSLEFANSLCYLAHAQNKIGNAAESKIILEQCIAIEEGHLGTDHVSTATALEELATAHGQLGDVRRQRELLERSLALREHHFGAGDVNIAATLNNLATVHGELGNVVQERDLLERSLAIKEQAFGRDHVRNATTLANLANVYCELGDATKGCGLLRHSLAIKERHFGPGHIETATTLNNLALACAETGTFAEMRALLERSLAIKERHFGSGHLETCLTLANLGLACSLVGAAADSATRFGSQARRACADSPSSCRHYTVMLRVAAVHAALGESSVAEGLTAQALGMLKEVVGPMSCAKALSAERTRTARLWSAAGREDMMRWTQRALAEERLATLKTGQLTCSKELADNCVADMETCV